MIIVLADKLYSWGRGQRDFAIVTANQILDGLGTVSLPQLPGSYLWLLLVTIVTRYWLLWVLWSTGHTPLLSQLPGSYQMLSAYLVYIVQWIHSIVALPKLPWLPEAWACNLINYFPPYLATTSEKSTTLILENESDSIYPHAFDNYIKFNWLY